MKNLSLIKFLLLIASSIMFMQCTHDTEYISGPPGADGIGIDGIDGVNGIDGVDGSAASCIECHSNATRDPIHAAYETSNHFNVTVLYNGQTLPEYGNRVACARCHTSQGFQEFVDTGIVSEPFAVPSTITCTTCHNTHRSFDFENDGNDFALRTIDPVHLITDPAYTIDLSNDTNPLGQSNTCVNCHQPRTFPPVTADTVDGKFMITSTHWGSHHGPQATMLEGIQGAEIAGLEGYPTPNSFPHRTGASCVSCHMGETTDGFDGAHTFFPTRGTCVSCHDDSDFPNSTSFDKGGFQTETEDRLEILAGLLANVVGQDVARVSSSDPYLPVFEADGVTPVTHIGIVIDGSPVRGLYDFVDAQAAWNYILIEEDKSEGVHNPAYVDALLPNSIDALD